MQKANLNQARSTATREKLIQAGRRLFALKGFTGVSAEELVQSAGMTRGALYHHFGGKPELFAEVYEAMQQDLSVFLEEKSRLCHDPWEELLAGIAAFLDACEDPGIQRVFFVDGPAVLGWDRCREADSRHTVALLKRGVEDAMRNKLMQGQPVEPLAHLLAGALREAGMWIAASPNPSRARQEASQAVARMLEGLRGAYKP